LNKLGILSIGDAFIDYISINSKNDTFEKALGGASVNVAVHLSRFGVPSYYVTKLGHLEDSHFVQKEMEKEKIKLDHSVFSSTKELSSVYIHLDKNSDRHFHAYVNNTPNEVLEEADIHEEAFRNKKIFYFGSGTLFHKEARKATEKGMKLAKKNDMLVTFDANIRLKRWESESECRSIILSLLSELDVVKLSEEELFFLFQVNTVEEGIKKLDPYKIPILLLTLGEDGAYGILDGQRIKVKGENVIVRDTTGSGDAFMATVLYCIYEKGYPTSVQELRNYVMNGNILGANVATKVGSLPFFENYKQIIDKK
jgi:fructokinase